VSIIRSGIWLALLVPIFIGVNQGAAQSRERLLVNATWLKAHLHDADLVLLHVGEKAEYDAAHIPGAHYITMADLSAPRPADPGAGEILELPTPETARAKLESLGVSDRSRVIVYFGKDWVSPATRIIFTLDWLGLGERVSMLDGGLPAWRSEGGAVTADLPTSGPGKLSGGPVKSLTVTKEWVNENRSRAGIALVDARAASFYDGVQSGRIKKGHIPGAKSLPFTTPYDDSNVLKSADELKKIFTNAGIKPGDTVVGYCHIGQQATAMLFAARTLGYHVLLYDGSFTNWEKHDLPVAVPPPKG
jgi:thiosulfate/3-mercaptopyruvate sulfurtransferase